MEFTVAVIVALGVLLLQPTALEAFPRFKPIAGQFDHPRAQQFNHPRVQQFDHPRVQEEEQFDHPRVQQAPWEQFDHPRVQSTDLATTQDISIVNCGPDGDLVNTILQASLGWLFAIYPNAADIAINCDFYGDGRCTAVTVQAPVGTTQADVDVCVNPDGSVCVTVFAAQPCTPSIFATSIPITIPVGTSSTGAPITLVIDIFGATSCVAVQLNAPGCPP